MTDYYSKQAALHKNRIEEKKREEKYDLGI
jgi:hypothetical protein